MELKFQAELWEWQGQGAWCFVSVPTEYYEVLKSYSSAPKRGFGSLRVDVTVGSSNWRTSIFPDSKSAIYLLPIKKAIRKVENISIGDGVTYSLKLVDF